MMKTAVLPRLWPDSFNKARHHSAGVRAGLPSWRLGLSIALIAVNAALLLSYIYSVNQFASQSYQITLLQQKLSGLNADNRQLNLKMAQATSMVGIQNDFLSAGYVLAGTPTFIQTDPVYTMR